MGRSRAHCSMIYRLEGRFISINLCLLRGAALKQYLVFKRLSNFALLTETFSYNFYESSKPFFPAWTPLYTTLSSAPCRYFWGPTPRPKSVNNISVTVTQTSPALLDQRDSFESVAIFYRHATSGSSLRRASRI